MSNAAKEELDMLNAGWEAEIHEIVRVAQQNPAALIDFLKCNYPRQWGLTQQQHRNLVRGRKAK